MWVYIPPTSTVGKCANRIYDRNEDGDMDTTDSPIQLQNMYNRKSNTYTMYRVENMDRYDDRLQVTTNLIDAYDLLMEFVAKHTSDKFCLIDNVNTSIRGMIAREVIGNILVHALWKAFHNAWEIIF